MAVIRIEFYRSFLDVPAFNDLETAKAALPAHQDPFRRTGYAVLFQLKAQYAVYIHNEDRYYSSYLPSEAKFLYGGEWKRGQPVDWKPISDISQAEIDILKEAGLENVVDILTDDGEGK